MGADNLGSSAHLHSVAYGNGKFVIIGELMIFTSSDGLTWDSIESGANLFGITYGSGLFVSVGDGGIIMNSQDGIKWQIINDRGLYSIASGNGVFVGAGGYRIAISNDGIKWVINNTGIPEAFNTSQVVYENGIFMIAGLNLKGTESAVLISSNGVNWQAVNWASYYMNDVSYKNYTYVAVGQLGAIVTSSDGQEWNPSNSGTLNHLYGITSGNGLFVAVGNNGTIVTSINGDSWSLSNVGMFTLNDITYGNGLFIAVGSGGVMLLSSDGINWTTIISGTTKNLLKITYQNNCFIAVGDNGAIVTSFDGINWTAKNSGTQNSLSGISYGNNTFVVVGYDIILQSDPIISQLNLSISKIGSGNGTVTSYPLGIDCGNDCTEQYAYGKSVTLTAIADINSTFSGWSGCDFISDSSCTVTMSGNKNITATFAQNCDRSLTIVIAPQASGTVTKNPDKANYCNNEQVTLTAQPNAGYSFSSWSGCDSSNSNTCSIAMSSNKTVTANFNGINYTVSFSKSGNGSVKVNGTSHTLPWSGQFASGTNVQIQAVPDTGWSFSNWSGDYTGGDNPTTVTMSGNKNITATFAQNCDRSLTIVIAPQASGTVTKNPDKANYCNNEQVTLTAQPNAGYSFSSWSGCDSSNSNTCSIAMSSNKTVTANFNQISVVNYTLSIATSGSGSVNVNGTVHTLPWSGQFPSGTNVQIEAISDSGWNFTNWTGDYTRSTNPTTLNISGNKNITANFSQNCDYSLTININPPSSGTVTKNPDKSNYCDNEQVTLTASPNENYHFSSWSDVDSNDSVTAQVTMSNNRTVTANFNQQTLYGPDFTGSWTSLVQSCKGSKCKIIGQLNIQNIGTESASSAVSFYLSDDSVYDEGDMYLKQVSTGTVKTGQNKNKKLSYSFPIDISATDKYVIAIIDADNTVTESNESNNMIVYGPIPRANLTGTWLSLTQQCKGPKCKIKGTLNVENNGGQDAISSSVRFYLSDDDTYNAGDAFLKQISSGTVKVSKSMNKKLSYKLLSGVTASGKYVIAVIDADDAVQETNESDNVIAYGPIP